MNSDKVVDLFSPASGRENTDSRRVVGGGGREARGDATWSPSPNYSPDEFYIRSEAKGGKTSPTVSARLLPEVHRYLTVLIQSGAYPYGSMTDFIRDATMHRLEQLASMNEDHQLRNFVNLQRQLARNDIRQNEVAANVKLVTDMKATASLMMEHEDWSELATWISDAWDAVDSLRHPYSQQLKTAIREWWNKFPDSHVLLRPNIYADRSNPLLGSEPDPFQQPN